MTIKQSLHNLLENVLASSGYPVDRLAIRRSDHSSHGDYTTNIAFLLGKELKRSPQDVANQIIEAIRERQQSNVDDAASFIRNVFVAGSGFINIVLTDAALLRESVSNHSSVVGNRSLHIMLEFAHPNTHKAFHIGHLRNITTGESLARILEAVGHRVIRVNYQGDVGMHIAKCLYAMIFLPAFSDRLLAIRYASTAEKVAFLGQSYAAGSQAHEESEEARGRIGKINKQIYEKDREVYSLYQETRQWSLDYFDQIYRRVGTTFDRLYFESEVYQKGKEYVEEGLKKGVFEASDGAIIFPGERYGLHNRVFITKEGNPTYEAKEMGLAPLQVSEFHPDMIIHVVGPEQTGYFQVCFEALARLFPEMRGKEMHLSYGWVRLKHGKMSSRTGQVVLGEWLLDEVKKSIYEIMNQTSSKYTKEEQEEIAEACAIAAVKYSFLKVGLSQEIAFDIEESVNIHGDSGPYLLYTYARCQSILRKGKERDDAMALDGVDHLEEEERKLVRHLLYFPEILEEAAERHSPSDIANYLLILAKYYNTYYGIYPIKDVSYRMQITKATSHVLQKGLFLLGIRTIARM